MSLYQIMNRVEEERRLNQTLLDGLLAWLDSEIDRTMEKKQQLIEEFAERDANLLRILEGDTPKPDAAPAPAPVKDADDELAA